FFVEANREGLHGLCALCLHQRYQRRGIHTTREERAQGNVSNHTDSDCISQELIQAINGFLSRTRERLHHPTASNFLGGPIWDRYRAISFVGQPHSQS